MKTLKYTSTLIAVADMEKSKWFYHDVLGLEVVADFGDNAILDGGIYDRIEKWYKDYLATEEARRNIADFDRWLPSYSWIPEIKKIDYLLWSRREEKSE